MADAVRIEAAGPAPPDVTGPRIVGTDTSGNVVGPIDRVTVTFDELLDVGTLTPSDVTIELPNTSTIAASQINDQGGNTFEIVFTTQTALGNYTVTVGPTISDTAGPPSQWCR